MSATHPIVARHATCHLTRECALLQAFLLQPVVLQTQAILVALMPARLTLQVPEISVLMAVGGYFGKFILFHTQILLPLVLYRSLQDQAAASTA